MSKFKYIIYTIFIVLVAYLGVNYWSNFSGAGPAVTPPKGDIAEKIESGNSPLDVPKNFDLKVFAKNLPGARVMVQDGLGNFWVSQTSQGKVTLIQTNEKGEVTEKKAIFKNLNKPHGLALDPKNGMTLYIAEEGKISKVELYTEDSLTKIADLPTGGRHTTRTIKFGPDNRLYVSIGSSCNVCIEKNKKRAAIYSMKKDGSDFRKVAGGLRNAVFFTWSYIDGSMWATEMGRDNLGDTLPPDEINIIKKGKNYGWPYCYGKQVRDKTFKPDKQFDCSKTERSYINLKAHVAPLDLAFVPEEGWPQDMWYDLLVAYHGSWNRSTPVGYKIKRIKLDDQGNVQGKKDFITGWLDKDSGKSWGRPVGFLVRPGGVMYVTDDKAGVIYKVTYNQNKNEGESTGNDLGKPVTLEYPTKGAKLGKSFVVKGSAKGTWYFEGNFSVRVLNKNNQEIASARAQAQGDWMTKEMVPFKAELTLPKKASGSGFLVLEKANPSGIPEKAESIRIPVNFN
ncbi:MAG: PQQ-dependent sugar dehydrogenase [Candidatus Magasanikbacteria bacterium]